MYIFVHYCSLELNAMEEERISIQCTLEMHGVHFALHFHKSDFETPFSQLTESHNNVIPLGTLTTLARPAASTSESATGARANDERAQRSDDHCLLKIRCKLLKKFLS
jgi:hypothetical protein